MGKVRHLARLQNQSDFGAFTLTSDLVKPPLVIMLGMTAVIDSTKCSRWGGHARITKADITALKGVVRDIDTVIVPD